MVASRKYLAHNFNCNFMKQRFKVLHHVGRYYEFRSTTVLALTTSICIIDNTRTWKKLYCNGQARIHINHYKQSNKSWYYSSTSLPFGKSFINSHTKSELSAISLMQIFSLTVFIEGKARIKCINFHFFRQLYCR